MREEKDLKYINDTFDKVKEELLLDIDNILNKQKEIVISDDSKVLDYLNECQLRLNGGSVESLLEINILTRVMEGFKLNSK